MNKRIFWSLILFYSLMSGVQAQRFNASILLGVNASQINGDDSAGFNKLGIHGGLRAGAILSEKTELGMELVFSQRGSQAEQRKNSSIPRLHIHLNYVSVPVTFTFKDWLIEDENYYRMRVHGGFSYGRLISSKVENSGLTELEGEFNENNFSWLIGASYFITPHWAVTARYSRWITALFNNDNSPLNADSLRTHYLTFRAEYMF